MNRRDVSQEERSRLLKRALISLLFNPTWTRYRHELQAEHPEGDFYRKVPYSAVNPIAIIIYILIGFIIGLIF